METNQPVRLHALPHPSAPVRQAGFPHDHPYAEECWVRLVIFHHVLGVPTVAIADLEGYSPFTIRRGGSRTETAIPHLAIRHVA